MLETVHGAVRRLYKISNSTFECDYYYYYYYFVVEGHKRGMQRRKGKKGEFQIGLGTGTDNRTGIFTGISPQNRYFAPVYRSTQCCSGLLSLSLFLYQWPQSEV